MHLLLLSNSRNPGGGFLDHAESLLRAALGEAPGRLLFFPFAAVNLSFDAYAALVRARFERMGYAVASAHKGSLVRAIAAADAFVVGGGNTFRLLHEMRRRGVLPLLRRRVLAGAPYVGWSAGANLACPTIRTTNDMPVIDPGGFGALNLVPFQINPHYTERVLAKHGGESRDDRIAEFLTLNPRVAVLGLREGSLVRVRDGRARLLLGPGARVFRHGRKPRDARAGADFSALLRP